MPNPRHPQHRTCYRTQWQDFSPAQVVADSQRQIKRALQSDVLDARCVAHYAYIAQLALGSVAAYRSAKFDDIPRELGYLVLKHIGRLVNQQYTDIVKPVIKLVNSDPQTLTFEQAVAIGTALRAYYDECANNVNGIASEVVRTFEHKHISLPVGKVQGWVNKHMGQLDTALNDKKKFPYNVPFDVIDAVMMSLRGYLYPEKMSLAFPADYYSVSDVYYFIRDNVTVCDDCGRLAFDPSDGLDANMNSIQLCTHCIEFGGYVELHDGFYTYTDYTIPVYPSLRAYLNDEPVYYHSSDRSDCTTFSLPGGEDIYITRSCDDDEFFEYFYPEDDDDDENDDGDCIDSYHSSREYVQFIPSRLCPTQAHQPMGLELEVEVNSSKSLCDKRDQIYMAAQGYPSKDNVYTYLHIEHDSSLDHGFEIVTSWTGIDVHEEQLNAVLNDVEIRKNLRSHDTSTCGLHIHLNKTQMSILHKTKLQLFFKMPENQVGLDLIARRKSGGYCYRNPISMKELHDFYASGSSCRPTGAKDHPLYVIKQQYHRYLQACRVDKIIPFSLKKWLTRNSKSIVFNNERYQALNWDNPYTVEFRLFKGTLKFTTVMATLEFVQAIYAYTKQCGLTELNFEGFFKFINNVDNARSTRYLHNYLIDRGVYNYYPAPVPKTHSKDDAISTATVYAKS